MKNKKNQKSVTKIAPLADFFKNETSASSLILFAALAGMIIANSGLSSFYFKVLATEFSITNLGLTLDISHLINDGLMTIFFLLVGLEIKRELTSGHLASFKKAIVPFVAAIGGMLIPALIYIAIAGDENINGWAIPVATDIALALVVLTVFGPKKISFLRPYLLGIAVIDDIGAILIIALVFSSGININWLAIAFMAVMVVVIFKYFKVQIYILYILAAILLWYGLYKSGVHPTIGGVILGLLAPVTPFIKNKYIDTEETAKAKRRKKTVPNSVSVVEWLEHIIHPWSAFLVVPLFAFANAGVKIDFANFFDIFSSSITWGIIIGLVVGKPVGIMLFTYSTKVSQLGKIPTEVKLKHILGVGNSAGIGFTVAIFISKLAFSEQALQDLAILSVLIGSLVSALLSILFFKISAVLSK
jgi:NhaA family Na+:H+ antiporter